ncbi:putative tnpA (plasmid) [Acinetobacter baumannii]|nr:putative tnpA [Acinetobacter baumannii]
MQLCCYDGGEIKIDSAAPAVDGPVQIRPAAIDLHVGFIHVPRAKIGRVTPVPAQPFFHFRRITLNPAVNRGVIDIHSAFSQHLLQLTVTDAVFAVPAYGPQNDVTLKMPAFEWVHVQLHQQKGMISLSPPTICNSAIASGSGWDGLKTLVAMATRLTATMADDPLNHVLDGYHRFRRYAPRMLRLLDLRAAPVALPLLEAVTALRTGLNDAAMTSFLRPSSKWHRHLRARGLATLAYGRSRCCSICAMRSAPEMSGLLVRRYGDLKTRTRSGTSHRGRRSSRCAIAAGGMAGRPASSPRHAVARAWPCRSRRHDPGGSIENGVLHIEKLEAAARQAPKIWCSISTSRSRHAHHRSPAGGGCGDRLHRSVHPSAHRSTLPLTGSANERYLGGRDQPRLAQNADATNTHTFWELIRIGRWHVEGEAYDRALAMVVEAQAALPWPGSGHGPRRLRATDSSSSLQSKVRP